MHGHSHLLSPLLDEVEEVNNVSVRQRVLNCVFTLAKSQLNLVATEILHRGPQFSPAIIGLIHLLGRDTDYVEGLITQFREALECGEEGGAACGAIGIEIFHL